MLGIITIAPVIGQSQHETHVLAWGQGRNNLRVGGDFFYGSTGISNRFVKGWYNGIYFDHNLKTQTSSRLSGSEMDRIGLDASWGFNFRHWNDTLLEKPGGYWIRVEEVFHLNASFSRDAFDLTFFGNRKLAGKPVDLAGFTMNSMSYRAFGFGLMEETEFWKGKVRIGLGINFIQGLSSVRAKIHEGKFYTAPSGEYLSTTLSLIVDQTDSVGRKWGEGKGKGGSVSFFASYGEAARRHFSFWAWDVGSISWNQSSYLATIDTSIFFDGVEVKDIFKPDSAYFAGYDSSYLDKVYKSKTGGYSTMLPAKLGFSYTEQLPWKKWKIGGGVDFRLQANYSARYSGLLGFSPWNFVELVAQPSFGGYTTWALRFEMKLNPSENFQVSLGSGSITETFSQSGLNMGLFLQLNGRF